MLTTQDPPPRRPVVDRGPVLPPSYGAQWGLQAQPQDWAHHQQQQQQP